MFCSFALGILASNIFSSVGSTLAQLPWLGVYLGYIPGAASKLTALLNIARDLAMKRLKRGSTKPDLFYYLVSYS